MTLQSLEFGVNTAGVLAEAVATFSHGSLASPGMVLGLNEIRIGLVRIAQRAIELRDPALLAELQRIGVIHAESAT